MRAITLAMVKVLPEPVTPSSVWKPRRRSAPLHQLVDGLRLVARRRVRLEQLERRIGKLTNSPFAFRDDFCDIGMGRSTMGARPVKIRPNPAQYTTPGFFATDNLSRIFMSLFTAVEMAPRDPILGLNEQFNADTNPNKVNLGVGVYFDDNGKLPLLQCVQAAEKTMMEKPTAARLPAHRRHRRL
jgi:hypothetical protein